MAFPLPKFLLGYVFILFGIFWIGVSSYQNQHNDFVDGIIVEQIPTEGTQQKRSVIEYTYASNTYRVNDTVNSQPPIHEIEERVKIRVSSKEPENGTISTYFRDYGWAFIFIIVGVILVIIQKIISFILRLLTQKGSEQVESFIKKNQ